MRPAGRRLIALALPVLVSVGLAAQEPVLRWGGDAEGGAPFVEADPNDPTRLAGFDVEVAELVAGDLGRRPQFVQIAFASLDQSALRGDFDIGMSGIEDTPARRGMVAASVPYYQFREVLTVRAADRGTYRTLADLGGRRVATLAGTIAYDLLLEAGRTHGIEAVSYDDDVHPYSDLAIGRVDAVLLDHVLAERAMRRHEGLVTHPEAVEVGYYIIITAPGNVALRDEVNQVLRAAMQDGRLEAIYRRWNIWNEDQPVLFARVLAGADTLLDAESVQLPTRWEATLRYLPSLLRAAVLTLVLSCLAMVLAVGLGVALAVGRVYGDRVTRAVCTIYIEVIRGTPVLLQLFVLYYGVSSFVRLPAFVAALLGLGLNYAAYEAEIYRASLEAVPKGQLDAARTLGFSERQIFSLVRAPQAFRFSLAPMTNDFVALLKDSSLVSVLTVVELTKQTQIFAANIGSWAIPGALCAALYLMMSLPIAHVARRLEGQWKAPTAS
ncbi:MAG: ABC transporter substrate-binding protein/permease [Vicinamibacterales bacterium]|nr:ABC transporter substrate-binding protein/permease [Vicinamibacterales bacterium]